MRIQRRLELVTSHLVANEASIPQVHGACLDMLHVSLLGKLGHYTNMPCQCGYPDGMSPLGRMVFPRAIPTLAWHICFIIPNKPQFGKISMKTTMTAGRSSENGGRFAGGHFGGGHDGMANLCKPITAYDFHVRYNKAFC